MISLALNFDAICLHFYGTLFINYLQFIHAVKINRGGKSHFVNEQESLDKFIFELFFYHPATRSENSS